ncbi:MAG: DNA photolyase family protein [Actinomycetota bacterium]|nr:DNA photolyase family protein [Actinomycetota bacterium]MDH5224546.1 DNA photolyase family protein [Actinomycetota bacterium]MDH5313177.1 DNA photolyase family protein [Actinomycetota bacterium]
MRVLVLFTRDLRVRDHPALSEACRLGDEVVPLFVIESKLMANSPNRARFLAESLIELDRSLAHAGGRLVVREGDTCSEVLELATSTACDAVFFTSDASAYARSREERLRAMCGARDIGIRGFPGSAVVEPGAVVPNARSAYRVFTPYLRAWAGHARRSVLPAPRSVRVPREIDAGRLPAPSRYSPTACDLPPGGERAGRARMRRWLARDATAYETTRNDLDGDLTSRLSPYLRFGCVSATEIVTTASGTPGTDAFVRQIAWRDFFRQLLADEPTMTWRDLRPGTAEPGRINEDLLEAWKAGRTGFPLVDAGMRQLLREGWMHNRARMITASFLTRNCGVPWQEGARHFSRHLVDGDPSSNSGNWQWVAGTGVPGRRSRALNPVRQATRFDSAGMYVRRYVDELAHVDDARIIRPWNHPELLRATGYAAPITEAATT